MSSAPKLAALFLTVFDANTGIELDFEVPEGIASVKSAAEGDASLFEIVKEYLIPKEALYGHLVTVCTRSYKVLGFPVRVADEKAYETRRNAFSFNISWVFARDAELAAYEPVVRKTGRVFEALERSAQILSDPTSRSRMHAVLEQLYEDLNSYAETSIVLDGPNVLDLRLFPVLPNPPLCHDWDVPVALLDLQAASDISWDLTVIRLLPYINGVQPIRRMAQLADVEPSLARSAIQHLLHASYIVIVDLFQYSNSYALVSGPAGLPATCGEPVGGDGMDLGRECAAYVAATQKLPDTMMLLKLYSKLRPSERLSDWMDAYDFPEAEVDVRRMIQFGIIKGFLRRVHLYPIWLEHPSFKRADGAGLAKTTRRAEAAIIGARGRRDSISPIGSGTAPLDREPSQTTLRSRNDSPSRVVSVPTSLRKLLDGTHHSDELCVRYRCSLDQLLVMLRVVGDVELVYI